MTGLTFYDARDESWACRHCGKETNETHYYKDSDGTLQHRIPDNEETPMSTRTDPTASEREHLEGLKEVPY